MSIVSDHVSARRHMRLPLHAGFWVASAALVLTFAVSGAPIPLFNTYRAEDGVTNADLGTASVVYFIAAATSLLVLGRLSDHLGRRPVALGALGCALLSCVVFVVWRGAEALFVARALQRPGLRRRIERQRRLRDR